MWLSPAPEEVGVANTAAVSQPEIVSQPQWKQVPNH